MSVLLTIILSILVALLFMLGALSLIWIRNDKVFEFMNYLVDNHLDLIENNGGVNELYDKMMYQFWRPLTIEEWFDK